MFYHLKTKRLEQDKQDISSNCRNERLQCYDWIDGQNFFDQPIKNDLGTYNNIKKIATDQGDDYTTGCQLDYLYFEEYYKMIAKDLNKKQALDADHKAIQQIISREI